jgi:hypothetical protein
MFAQVEEQVAQLRQAGLDGKELFDALMRQRLNPTAVEVVLDRQECRVVRQYYGPGNFLMLRIDPAGRQE